MLNKNEVEKDLKALENALAQQHLEGLKPSKQVISELERVAHGEIALSKVLKDFKKRLKNGQILKSR